MIHITFCKICSQHHARLLVVSACANRVETRAPHGLSSTESTYREFLRHELGIINLLSERAIRDITRPIYYYSAKNYVVKYMYVRSTLKSDVLGDSAKTPKVGYSHWRAAGVVRSCGSCASSATSEEQIIGNSATPSSERPDSQHNI